MPLILFAMCCVASGSKWSPELTRALNYAWAAHVSDQRVPVGSQRLHIKHPGGSAVTRSLRPYGPVPASTVLVDSDASPSFCSVLPAQKNPEIAFGPIQIGRILDAPSQSAKILLTLPPDALYRSKPEHKINPLRE